MQITKVHLVEQAILESPLHQSEVHTATPAETPLEEAAEESVRLVMSREYRLNVRKYKALLLK